MTDAELSGLRDLAELVGIQTWYKDAWGAQRLVAAETLQALLSVMGFRSATPAEVSESIEQAIGAEWADLLPPAIVVDPAPPYAVPVAVPDLASGRLDWRIILEDGATRHGGIAVETLAAIESRAGKERRHLVLSEPLPIGYHRLRVSWNGRESEATLIAAPAASYLPPDFAGDPFGLATNGEGRVWGLAVQLYSLRSPPQLGASATSPI